MKYKKYMNKEIEIPEGYEARIEGNKVIIELKESENEKIRKAISYAICQAEHSDGMLINNISKDVAIAWLEKQKEQKPAEWSAYDKATIEYIIEDIKELRDEETDEEVIDTYDRELNLLHCINDSVKLCNYTNPAEWSEEDEKMLWGFTAWIPEEELAKHNITRNGILEKLKSLCPQPNKEIYQAAKHDLAIRFMNYLDENRPEGKMSLSNGECEDIDKAFKENDWAKIMRYAEKYSTSWKPSKWRRYIWAVNLHFDYDGLVRYEDNGSYEIVTAGNKPKRQVNGEYILLKDISSYDWKPSEEQTKVLKEVVLYFGNSWVSHKQEVLESLYNDIKKL